jgi:hypothetical protein
LLDRVWDGQIVDVAFAADGADLLVLDQFGKLTRLSATGANLWQVDLGTVAKLAVHGRRIYAAGRDGRLRALTDQGEHVWTVDCTPALLETDPMTAVAASAATQFPLHTAARPPTVPTTVPTGPNLLRTGDATLTVGGTAGWQSSGEVQAKASDLVNGRFDDMTEPWLDTRELFWSAYGTRQVWAEIAFKKPTHVRALTVYENPNFPDSWPTEGLVQVWDEAKSDWKTAARGSFLNSASHTYDLDLNDVKKLRYVPWQSYFRNFHTSEIEVR